MDNVVDLDDDSKEPMPKIDSTYIPQGEYVQSDHVKEDDKHNEEAIHVSKPDSRVERVQPNGPLRSKNDDDTELNNNDSDDSADNQDRNTCSRARRKQKREERSIEKEVVNTLPINVINTKPQQLAERISGIVLPDRSNQGHDRVPETVDSITFAPGTLVSDYSNFSIPPEGAMVSDQYRWFA
ncbi:hypothetical protein QCA50_008500 [Cerrena zonata]|uniref:Uncharacterized protein n=1 Tax=Cerrena zonata TaxID=2478898 RepID=A0AAW0GAI1_9APHY